MVQPANPKRRWIRAGAFWLCIALAGLIGGSWIKSYWRADFLNYVGRGGQAYWINDNFGRIRVVSMSFSGPELLRWHTYRPAWSDLSLSWRWGGFAYVQHTTMSATAWYIPHWFSLALCVGGAWWAGRPWRRGRRDDRGFEVVPGDREPGVR